MNDDFAMLRVDYDGPGFGVGDAGSDPMALFMTWFEEARARDSVVEPNAMALATCSDAMVPSVRMVLLKGVDAQRASFVWYTNLESRKGREIEAANAAALCWWWPGTPGRQVRAVGRVEPVERATVEEYFATRPPAARAAACTSQQSRAVPSTDELHARCAELDPTSLSAPPHWGGLRLIADELEFWHGRAGRLHDRITFLRLDDEGVPRSAAGVVAAGGLDALRAVADVVEDAYGTSWMRARLAP